MLTDETVLSFSEAARALPRVNGRKIHATTLWRWARKGVQGVRLEARRLGGRFVTSLEALERFSRELAERELPGSHPAVRGPRRPTRSEAERERAVQEAEERLRAAGFC